MLVGLVEMNCIFCFYLPLPAFIQFCSLYPVIKSLYFSVLNDLFCVQSVLAYAVRQNKQSHLASATVQYLDAWRQVTEVLFSVAPYDSLPFPLRFSLQLQIIFELLTKVGYTVKQKHLR